MPSEAALRCAENITSRLCFYGNKPLERQIADAIDAEFMDAKTALDTSLVVMKQALAMGVPLKNAIEQTRKALAKVRTDA